MRSAIFTAVAFLAAAVTATPFANSEGSCEGPYGKLPCGSKNATKYTVVSHDTLTTIATKFGSGACDIAKYNNLTNPNLIFPGEQLIVPANCTHKPDTSSCLSPQPKPGNATCVNGLLDPPQYQVITGDTLTIIASNFNLTLPALEDFNKKTIHDPNSIFPGEKIRIPVCKGCTCETFTTHTVQQGDTISAIALAAGLLVGQVEAANPGIIPTNLHVGDKVKVPKCECK